MLIITSRYIPRLWKIDVVYGKIGGNVEALAESACCSAIFILSSVYIVITSVWLGGFLSPKCLHYGENRSV